jgi:long-chain fatty acid transport protein
VKRALALVLLTTTAHAGGLQRPNGISARGVGMGGAWCALADDATAMYFNPGALDATTPHVHVGGELVVGPRSYTPLEDDGTNGAAQKTTIVAPVPVLGVVGRFDYDGRPSRFTLGLGVWNTFGGRASYDVTGMPALDATQELVIEVNAAAAVHISDKLAIGGALRVGIGMFATEATMNPFDADLSATGVGLGMTWGALVRPTETLRVGLTWRSPLRVTTKGSGVVEFGGPPERHDVEHRQNWPQQVLLGLGWQVSPHLKLATQLDWSQWSQIQEITVVFPGGALPNQIYPEYWKDSWAVRLGGEYALSQTLSARAGTYFDSAAVPDFSIERQYADSNKVGIAAGGSVRTGPWRFDAAVDGIIPRTRTVPNTSMQALGGVGALANKAPGDYRGTLVTFELAAAREF